MRTFALLALALLVPALVPPAPATATCADASPVNDCRENATEIATRHVRLRVSTQDAGMEPDEFGACGITAGTVWWRFTALRDSSGALSVHDSDYSAAVGVYEARPDGGLDALSCASGWSGNSWASFDCVAGRTYYVQGGGDEGGTGTLDLFGDVCQLAPEAPAAPVLNASRTQARGEVALSWSIPDDGASPLTAFHVRGGADCVAFTPLATLPPDATSLLDAGVPEGGWRCYEVLAQNAVGATRSNLASALPLGLPPPPSLVVATGKVGAVRTAWWAPHDGGRPIQAFRVYGADDAAGPYALLAEVDASVTAYAEEGLGARVTRHHRVAAVNEYGEGPASRPAAGTTLGVPTAPRDVRTAYAGLLGTRVSWAAPVDDGGTPLLAYHVYRGEKGGPLAHHATVHAAARAYEEELPLLKVYDYAVLAVNAMGASPLSARACGEGFPYPAPLDGC